MVDIFPMPGTKSKLKSLGFANSITAAFNLNFNKDFENEEFSEERKPSQKRARSDDEDKESDEQQALKENFNTSKHISAGKPKKLCVEKKTVPVEEKNEFAKPPQKSRNFNMEGNFRRLNMKSFRQKGKSSKFSSTGTKFKKFNWKKNKNKILANAKYGMKLDDDDGHDAVNYNLIGQSPVKIDEEKEIVDEMSNEFLFSKLKKPDYVTKKLEKKREKAKKSISKSNKENGEKIKKVAKPKFTKEEAEKKKKSLLKEKNKKKLQIDESDEVQEERGKEKSNVEEDDQEMEPKAKKMVNKKSQKTEKITKKVIDEEIDDQELCEAEEQCSMGSMAFPEPFLKLTSTGQVPKLPGYAYKILEKDFGHRSFKMHQEEAIARIACGLSTLVVLSTGYGKSLIYQFAAKLYAKQYPGSTVLVVSPLISLMQDQLHNLSKSLKAAVCDSNMTEKEYHQLLADLNEGKCNILFMSPEAIINRKVRNIPRLAFVCIDEVHCLSQWSHNFRPSYLQLCQILRDQYNVKCILGLTATATNNTIEEIRSYFDIEKSNIIKDCDLPPNLLISASKDYNKDQALIELLKSEQFRPYANHVIVYCSRREQTEKLSHLLRLSLQLNKKKFNLDELAQTRKAKGLTGNAKTFNFKSRGESNGDSEELEIAEAYHAGLSSNQRKRIQNMFIKGKLQIIVATMAFGMGIDMSNIRAIIHYNMPKSIENYVQEIGRAGRDGQISRCHLFLETQREDINEIKKYIHMNGYDQLTIKKLVMKIFDTCECSDKANMAECANKFRHNVALPISELVDFLDIKEETILTLLCYLEAGGYLQIRSNCFKTCLVRSYKGAVYLADLAKRNEVASFLLKLKMRGDKENSSSDFTVNVMEVCEELGSDYETVRQKLKQLEWETNGTYRNKTGLSTQFETVSFYIKRRCVRDEEEIDEINDLLWKRVTSQMNSAYSNFKSLYRILSENSFGNIFEYLRSFACQLETEHKLIESEEEGVISMNQIVLKSNRFKEKFNSYFSSILDLDEYSRNYNFETDDISNNESDMKRLISNVRKFIYTYEKEVKINGLVIARIFHGIGTPRYPNEVWGRNRLFWRCHLDFDFEKITKVATEQLLNG